MFRSSAKKWHSGVAASIAAALTAVTFSAAPATAAPIEPHPDKPDAPVTSAYIEVNSTDLSVVGDYQLAGSGAPVFDMAIIFAANVNYDVENKRHILGFNERVTATLTDTENQIRPLQAQGTKVLLSILGNHQGAGFDNFPTRESALDFAQQIGTAVDKYGLDGVDLDNEYVNYGVNGTGQRNPESFIWFIKALRAELGEEKIIHLYNISLTMEVNGESAGDYIDYAVNAFYGGWQPPNIAGMTKDQYGPSGASFSAMTADQAAESARRTVAEGYGEFHTYNLTDHNREEYISQFTQELYGKDAVYTGDAPPLDIVPPTVTYTQDGTELTVTVTDDIGVGELDITTSLADERRTVRLNPVIEPGSTKVTVTMNLANSLKPGEYRIPLYSRDTAGNFAGLRPLIKITPSDFAALTCNGGTFLDMKAKGYHAIAGTSTDETLSGTPGNDFIIAMGGADAITAGEGDDVICGLGGNDVIRGNIGTDALYGGAANDKLFGNAGDDSLFGEDGNDHLLGGSGTDVIDGGAGRGIERQ